MKIRSLVCQLLVTVCLATLTGCVEYRHRYADGRDRYIGWPTIKPNLDPQMGSRAKAYSGIEGWTQPYVGGNVSKKHLTMNVGVVQYLSESSSIEFGCRFRAYTIEDRNVVDDDVRIDWHNDETENMFYFGGRINF
jgi:hypothetical protein